MGLMKHYRVISGSDIKSLEEQINDIMKNEGCELAGGVSFVTYADQSTGYIQAIEMEAGEAIINDDPEWIPDGKNGFYHGVYQDEKNKWTVLHMSDCEGGERCRLFKYLNDPDCSHVLLRGYEYTVTEDIDGAFNFDPKQLPEESA